MPYITLPEPKYPLTELEKEWLEDRQENLEIFGGYFCPDCPEFVLEDEGFMYCGRGGWEQCVVANPHKFIFKDAAEFEARVAAKLAEGPEDCSECFWGTKGWSADNAEGRLKHARLAVEVEMELP